MYKRFSKTLPANAPSADDKKARINAIVDEIGKYSTKDIEVLFVDESHFSNQPYVSRGWFKCGEGGFTTKIHALVDGLGNPIKFILTGGHRNDITQAAELLKEQHDTIVLADKGYDSQELMDTLHSQGCFSVIPSRKNAICPREIDKELYKERFLIEAFFLN